ncbi:MAG: UDP-N-acetylmuramate dehydrogenase [Halopseudomonas sp.]
MQFHVDLSPFNSFQLPCVARQFIQVDTRQELLAALAQHGHVEQPLLVLGGGSNVIFTDDFDGLCLRVNSRGIQVQPLAEQLVRVRVEAGEPWHPFVGYCLEQGWYGLENLALIPGTVGAAPIQNIGAYGVEVKQRIHHVEVWDRNKRALIQLSNKQCQFGYRDSLFKSIEAGRYLIVSVSFDLSTEFTPQLVYGGLAEAVAVRAPTARQVFDAVVGLRQRKLPDPAQLANAGSFFKNPVLSQRQCDLLRRAHPDLVAYPDPLGMKLAAGWLIDQAGWKGVRQGAVGVHAQQALVLVNYGGASGEQLLALARAIQVDIQQRFGVALEIEPRVI